MTSSLIKISSESLAMEFALLGVGGVSSKDNWPANLQRRRQLMVMLTNRCGHNQAMEYILASEETLKLVGL
jgi:hypothetical protein